MRVTGHRWLSRSPRRTPSLEKLEPEPRCRVGTQPLDSVAGPKREGGLPGAVFPSCCCP